MSCAARQRPEETRVTTIQSGGRSQRLAADDPFDDGPFAWAPYLLPFAPRPEPAGRRALVAILVAWVPLAILSALEGLALGRTRHESFLLDFAAYGRYVIAIPALVYASAAVLPRITKVVRHFVDSGLIAEADRGRYEALVASTRRLVTTRWADAAIVIVAYVVTAVRSPQLYPSDLSTWVAPISDGTAHVSLAGWWRTVISQPLLQALLGVWLWRVLLWTRFLLQTSRLPLRLIATHPDSLGGLRFTLMPIRGFAFVAFAIGALFAGSVAESVIVDGQPLWAFRFQIVAHVLAVLVMFAGPELVWRQPLIRLQGWGTLHYGRLASEMGRAFQERWLAEGHRADAEALEAEDFSATTDLYSITANVRSINVRVLDMKAVMPLVAASLLPYLPIVFAVMPLDDILKFARKAIV